MDNVISHMNCLQLCLYNICKKYCVADYLMFCGGWCFSHDNNINLSQAISLPFESYENIFLKEYQGLSTEIIPFNPSNIEFMLQKISEKDCEEIEVVIHIDSYECPWHRGFQKLNIPHYVHAVDINREKKVIICDDPYFNVFKMELPFENFQAGCKTIRVFQYDSVKRNINFDTILSHIINKTNINQITGDIFSFAHRLLDVKTQNELFDYMEDVYLCSNVRVLKFVADSRYGLSYFFNKLNSLSKNNLTTKKIADLFELIGSIFEKINHFYIKLYYRSSDLQAKLQSIHDKLIEVTKIENDIFILLSQMVVQQ